MSETHWNHLLIRRLYLAAKLSNSSLDKQYLMSQELLSNMIVNYRLPISLLYLLAKFREASVAPTLDR